MGDCTGGFDTLAGLNPRKSAEPGHVNLAIGETLHRSRVVLGNRELNLDVKFLGEIGLEGLKSGLLVADLLIGNGSDHKCRGDCSGAAILSVFLTPTTNEEAC